jgi:hypothetical protein
MRVVRVPELGGRIQEVKEGKPMPMSSVFTGSYMAPGFTELPIPALHQLDGVDEQFSDPMFDWCSPIPEGIVLSQCLGGPCMPPTLCILW